jgi:hypothetical protein
MYVCIYIHIQDLEAKIVRHIGIDGSRQMLPAVCKCLAEWGGPKMLADFEDKIPKPVRYVLDK